MNELMLTGGDNSILKKVKKLVDRIMARCRQSGVTLKGLCSVVAAQSPEKEQHSFVDMHAESTKHNQQLSHHFMLHEVKRAASPHKLKKDTLNLDVADEHGQVTAHINTDTSSVNKQLQTVHNKY